VIFRSFLAPALRQGFHQVSDAEMARDPSEPPAPIDIRPVLAAGRQVTDWLLDVARSRTNDPADTEAIERVRVATHAPLAGGRPWRRPGTCGGATLVVLGIRLTAFEAGLGVSGLAPLFGAVYDLADPLIAKVVEAARASLRTASPARTRTILPVIVRRRPRVAHGADELEAGPVGSILIIG